MDFPDYSSQGGAAGDPYYIEAAGTRFSYYGLSGVPSLVEGGNIFDIFAPGNTSTNLGNTVDAALNRNAYFEITSANATIENNEVSLDLDILPYLNGEFTIFAAVKENETVGNVLPPNVGGNGENEFVDVMMKMIPNAEGTTIDFTSGTSYQTTLTADLSNTFIEDYTDLNVVVFIQHMPSKTIMQAANADTTLGTEDFISDSTFKIYPNPANNGFVNITMQQAGTIEVYDLTGRLVVKSIDLKVGDNKLNINELSNGVYITKINSNNKTSSQKLIIN
ncbi:T9SS type A sorting domain-containing protein [Mesonia aquimarina]|uniref:T9SS type A sorting domain-containing protein n=1 Tax=Mesonia aquimarina TaxID=1504967 RepID=UPI000EF6056D|nr:T9SS type A sorting domain-containing protein [Mesonia aquimarina]